MGFRNRYRVTFVRGHYYAWLKRWYWPFWCRLGHRECDQVGAQNRCELHAAKNVVWTSESETERKHGQ
jgi:hypothetical protein